MLKKKKMITLPIVPFSFYTLYRNKQHRRANWFVHARTCQRNLNVSSKIQKQYMCNLYISNFNQQDMNENEKNIKYCYFT
jgi:hypothetical protein